MKRSTSLAAALAFLAGCSTDYPASAPPPFGVYESRAGDVGFDGAEFRGTLQLRDDCLVLEDGLGSVALVLEEGAASWDSDTETLRFTGRDFAVGDALSAGGGTGATDPGIDCGDLEFFRVAPGSLAPEVPQS